jgi:predicted flap endonuclease-1-like 5' DNA nuclease
MTNLSEIEGVGDTYATQLEAIGITSIEALLESGSTRSGRISIVEKTGISKKRLLNWVNRADLARINGVSTQYADLLEVAGVDTVVELALRSPENLTKAMADINDEKSLVRKVPGLSQVQDWILQAAELPRVISY